MAVVVADKRGQLLQSTTVHCAPRDAPLRRPGVRSEFWRRTRMNLVGSRNCCARQDASCVFVGRQSYLSRKCWRCRPGRVSANRSCAGGADSTCRRSTERKGVALCYRDGRPSCGIVTLLPSRSCEIEVLRAQRVSINVAVPTDELRPLISTLAPDAILGRRLGW